MKHIWSVLCKKSSIDVDTNNISLDESLEEITFHIPKDRQLKLPINFPFDFEIVSFWTTQNPKGGEQFELKIGLIDPNKAVLSTINQKIIFPENKKRLRTRIKSSAIPFTKEGEYVFEIRAKEKKGASFKVTTEIPVTLILKKQ